MQNKNIFSIRKNISWYILALCITFVIAASTYFHIPLVEGDGYSHHIPVKHLIEKGNLNLTNPLNEKYNTTHFRYTSTDSVVTSRGEYPVQTVGMILLSTIIYVLRSINIYYGLNLLFSILILIFSFLIVRNLSQSTTVVSLTTLAVTASPLLIYWTILDQNIIPATAFLIAGTYFFTIANENIKNIVIGTILLALSVYIRIPFALFIIPILLTWFVKDNLQLTKKIKWVVSTAFMFLCIAVLINVILFSTPLFSGYIEKEINEKLPSEQVSILEQILQKIISTFLTTIFLISGSVSYFGIFLLFTPALLFFYKKAKIKQQKWIIFVLSAIIFNLPFYLLIQESLWKPLDPTYAYAHSLAFFRYLIPLYILSIISISIPLEKIIRKSSKIILVTIILAFALMPAHSLNSAFNYEGGANIKYIEEYFSKVNQYSIDTKEILDNNSVILYATRLAYMYTYHHEKKYNFFWYDGIPVEKRLNHTKEIVNKLLADNITVYYFEFEPPYDRIRADNEDIDIYEVEEFLRTEFIFDYAKNSGFRRNKFRIYELKNE